MRPLFALAAFLTLTPVAHAVPLEPGRPGEKPPARPRLFAGRLAEALEKQGCMPDVHGAWTFDVRGGSLRQWRPAPPARVEDCVAQVIHLFPPDITGAVIVWPLRDN